MIKNNCLRVIELQNGETWISVHDAGRVLKLADVYEEIRKYCLHYGIKFFAYFKNGKVMESRFISELNFYTLIAKAAGENVKEYRTWLFNDMLPSLLGRKKYVLSSKDSPFEIRYIERPLAFSAKRIGPAGAKKTNKEVESYL